MGRVVLPWNDVVAFRCEVPLAEEARSIVSGWLPERWKSAVQKRQEQSLAARWCAFEAARIFGHELTTLPIDERGEPLWPAALIGSLAHTDTEAVAVIARPNVGRGIGIDIEDWMTVSKMTSVEEAIATESERKGLPSDPQQRARMLTRIFSAKEALYKALHPFVKSHIDFLEVELVSGDSLRVIATRPELARWRTEYPVVFIEGPNSLISIISF